MSDFSIWALRHSQSFLFFLFQRAFGNVVRRGQFGVLFASKYGLFLFGITVCFGVRRRGRVVLLPPRDRLFSVHPLVFSVGCDTFISEGLTTAIILLIQKN